MSKQVTIVNHTHWDREWYFSDQDSLVLSSLLFTNTIKELEKHPHASFVLDGQISILSDYLQIIPEMEERVKQLVAKGQLQIGPWYTQPDALHIQGESLLRNGIVGSLLTRHLGQSMPIGYLPDTFGFNAQMPVILRQLGLNRFLFWRGIDPKKVSSFYFNWDSLGGGATVQAVSMPQGYGTGMLLAPTHEYVDGRLDKAINFIAETIPNTPDNILIPSGNDQMNIVADIEEKIQEINSIGKYSYKIGTYQDFFDSLDYKELPHYKGELIDPVFARVHRTCGSSRMDVKLAATKLEHTLIHEVEPVMVIGHRVGIDLNTGVLVSAWKKLLESQAHDSMAGSVVDSVNEDILHRLKQGQEIADGILNTIQKMLSIKLGLGDNQVLLINPLPKTSTQPVNVKLLTNYQHIQFDDVISQHLVHQRHIPARENVLSQTPHGNEYLTEPGYYEDDFQIVVSLPALGYRVIEFHSTDENVDSLSESSDEYVLKTTDWQISVRDGKIDLDWQGRHIKNAIKLVDDGNAGDTYDFSPVQNDHPVLIEWDSVSAEHQADWQEMILRADAKLPLNLDEREQGTNSGRLPIVMDLRVSPDNHLSIAIEVQNDILQHRLRLLVDSGLDVDSNKASVPYGFITRKNKKTPTEWQSKYAEMPINIWPMDNNVSVARDDAQMSVFSREIKEYAQSGGQLEFTLLATSDQLGKPNLIYRPGRASGDTTNEGHIMIATPGAEILNQGLRYNVDIFWGAATDETTIATEQERLAFNPLAYQKQNLNLFFNRLDNKLQDSLTTKQSLPSSQSFDEVSEQLTVSAVYPAYYTEKATVMRLQNMTKRPLTYQLREGESAINALEEPIAYNDEIPPYDVLTILIQGV